VFTVRYGLDFFISYFKLTLQFKDYNKFEIFSELCVWEFLWHMTPRHWVIFPDVSKEYGAFIFKQFRRPRKYLLVMEECKAYLLLI
jgi:hypothetical protein